MDLPDGSGQLVALPQPVLEQIGQAGLPAAQQGEGVGLVVVGGQHHHAGPGVVAADLVGGFDPFQLEVRRHLDVGDHHVRLQLRRPGEERGGVLGHADHLDTLRGGQEGAHALPYQDVVVAQEDPDGRLVSRHQPPPSHVRSTRAPPSRVRRG